MLLFFMLLSAIILVPRIDEFYAFETCKIDINLGQLNICKSLKICQIKMESTLRKNEYFALYFNKNYFNFTN